MDSDGKQRSGSKSDDTATESVYAVDGGERAPFRYRLAAMLYDTIIVAAIWVFTIVLLVTLTGDSVVGAWVQSLLFIELFVFFAFFWIHKGQTIGMLAWRLRLESEQPFTLRKAFFRFCGAMASFLTLGVGYYWIWIDPLRRSWPDIFSDSYVVRYSKKNQSRKTS